MRDSIKKIKLKMINFETNLDFLNQLKVLKKSGAAKNEKALKLKTLDQARDVKVKAILTPPTALVILGQRK